MNLKKENYGVWKVAKENIFIALSHYVPRPNLDPKENHFTEAFAYILNQNKELLYEILKHGIESNKKSFDLVDSSSLELVTQKREKGFISDMEVTGKDLLVLFENKIAAKEGHNFENDVSQLTNYVNYLKKKKVKHKFLFYVTMGEENGDSSDIIHLHWSEVYDVIKKYQLQDKEDKYLPQFMEYMEAEKMGSFKGFTEESIDAWAKSLEFEEELKKFMPKLKTLLNEKEYTINKEFVKGHKEKGFTFDNDELKKLNIEGFVGFFPYVKEPNEPDPTGVYCLVQFEFKNGLNWPNTIEPQSEGIYTYGKCVAYDQLLSKIIKDTEDDKQAEEILNWFKESLNKITGSAEFKALLK